MSNKQQVVCVDDVFPAWVHQIYTALPVKGVTYTVRSMSPGRGKLYVEADGKLVKNGGSDAQPEVHMLLEELVNPPDPFCNTGELGFRAERFAPLETTEEEAEASAADAPALAAFWKN